MQSTNWQIQTLRREAARCERLCAGSYDPALWTQLLSLAREYRSRAAAMEAGGRMAA
ncbi:hypothetical protein [Sphingomonas nostoxanthinifaciens]|uniref:hypothetical protein n=1 Tax=Sphingomonas nostoxanthinifaciens TaxID=2872652 RepID=UPI001CC20559|nr:hypothetical protein [Sphingomonas nostoxanthinifaciens]UAK23977.1 hypothetical protein K8P63_16700 [Sphingomonas nostoxanthinifaciens]